MFQINRTILPVKDESPILVPVAVFWTIGSTNPFLEAKLPASRLKINI